MKKLAVLGCGAQSQIFCLNAPKHLGNDYFVTSVCAKNHEHAVELEIVSAAVLRIQWMICLN